MKKLLGIVVLGLFLITPVTSHETNKKASFICTHNEHNYDYQFFIDLENSKMELGPYIFHITEITDKSIFSEFLSDNQKNFLVFERYSGGLLNTVTNLSKTEIIRSDSYRCKIVKKIF